MQISNSSHCEALAALPKAAADQARISAAKDASPGMPSAVQAPTLTANTALFLDFDGTLVDLAAGAVIQAAQWCIGH